MRVLVVNDRLEDSSWRTMFESVHRYADKISWRYGCHVGTLERRALFASPWSMVEHTGIDAAATTVRDELWLENAQLKTYHERRANSSQC
jgi:hypothetical protein